MSPLQDKPIIHGRDHMAGGADPIPGMGSGGIAFDTYPQDGNWLYVETDDSTGAGGSPSGYGIELSDYTSGEGGIGIAALGGGDVEIKATGGGGINIHTTGDSRVGSLHNETSGRATLTGDPLRLLSTSGGSEVVIGATTLDLYIRISETEVNIDYGGSESTPGTPLLRIVASLTAAEYHIQSGASWVADL